MEMSLFLNESYIFHRLRMWSIVLWHSCVFGRRGALKTPFARACDFRFRSKKNIRILDLDPRTEAYCLSLNSVCFKRLPRKKYFHLLNSYNIKRVFGVVYC
ncbi:BMC_2a_G0024790.mRNA.1.CDS.1 [Saccharomyces cerevisiae]|nr:BMC_2a_G0024790.mRNA.1.CDS.1 [Saccharomyces cerevisiae]CAI7087511.1 BMC_2a_G0024790.mRNA.1.CDS.1 [Saccharomyces cerevisiae]